MYSDVDTLTAAIYIKAAFRLTRNALQSLACSPRGIAVTSSSEQVKQNWVMIAPQNSVLIPKSLAVVMLSERSQTADKRGVYIFAHIRTEVHQILTQSRQIIADEPFEIGIAIFHSV